MAPSVGPTRAAPIRIESGVVIHGGVGTLARNAMTPEMEAAYREVLAESLEAGERQLADGGSALDAVIAAVAVMEDSPLFNAGRGSNFDERGVITMDASVMTGPDREAGAVAGVRRTRSPAALARRVMEASDHVLLIGDGAEAFAEAEGLEMVSEEFFHTERRWKEMEVAKARGSGRPNVLGDTEPTGKSGTVGAVARDSAGRLAAATSTGGMANKTWGRVGDSPIVGAGTYAGPLCAVSCTGWGEYFIRHAVAFDVHARMEYTRATLRDAVRGVVWDTLHEAVPGSGGLVAIDRDGWIEAEFNTPGMYRGWLNEEGRGEVAIYRDAPSAL